MHRGTRCPLGFTRGRGTRRQAAPTLPADKNPRAAATTQKRPARHFIGTVRHINPQPSAIRQPPAPSRSSVPPCSGQSRPSPSGGREDAASLDRPCARRLCDLAVGAEECSRRGSNKRMEPTYTISKQIFNVRRTPPASPCSVSIRIAVHTYALIEEIVQQQAA